MFYRVQDFNSVMIVFKIPFPILYLLIGVVKIGCEMAVFCKYFFLRFSISTNTTFHTVEI